MAYVILCDLLNLPDLNVLAMQLVDEVLLLSDNVHDDSLDILDKP